MATGASRRPEGDARVFFFSGFGSKSSDDRTFFRFYFVPWWELGLPGILYNTKRTKTGPKGF